LINIRARLKGGAVDSLAAGSARVEDGVHGVRFIECAVAPAASSDMWTPW
jgi:hypothetical protein